jgi:Rieske Fe-S protein
MSHPTTRRTVLAGAAGISAAAVLVACGSDAPPPAPPGPRQGKIETLGNASDVPVSGGLILADRGIVITQPSPGEYRAFSAICTHKGCTVAAVQDNIISCQCHNAKYSATDGAVEGGPAPAPLEPKSIRVEGNTIELITP